MGILHAPTPGSVSPALFHGESLVPRNKSSESRSRLPETAPRQEAVRQEENVIHVGAQCSSKPDHLSHPPSHVRHTNPPALRQIKLAHGFILSKNSCHPASHDPPHTFRVRRRER